MSSKYKNTKRRSLYMTEKIYAYLSKKSDGTGIPVNTLILDAITYKMDRESEK